MTVDILKIFVRGVARYFEQVTQVRAEVGTPYLREASEGLPAGLDFGAVIGITGAYRGVVYYTAPRALLTRVLERLGEREPTDGLCADLVGEITNTIAGNAREHLGSSFLISVPFILKGRPEEVRLPSGAVCYVIPIRWADTSSHLLIALEAHETTVTP